MRNVSFHAFIPFADRAARRLTGGACGADSIVSYARRQTYGYVWSRLWKTRGVERPCLRYNNSGHCGRPASTSSFSSLLKSSHNEDVILQWSTKLLLGKLFFFCKKWENPNLQMLSVKAFDPVPCWTSGLYGE